MTTALAPTPSNGFDWNLTHVQEVAYTVLMVAVAFFALIFAIGSFFGLVSGGLAMLAGGCV